MFQIEEEETFVDEINLAEQENNIARIVRLGTVKIQRGLRNGFITLEQLSALKEMMEGFLGIARDKDEELLFREMVLLKTYIAGAEDLMSSLNRS